MYTAVRMTEIRADRFLIASISVRLRTPVTKKVNECISKKLAAHGLPNLSVFVSNLTLILFCQQDEQNDSFN